LLVRGHQTGSNCFCSLSLAEACHCSGATIE
jgi:hypothetical protein